MSVDAQAVGLARVARVLAERDGISPVAAFVRLNKEPVPKEPQDLRPMYNPSASAYDSEKVSPEKARHAKERKLRLDLEAALLRLDACCSGKHGSTVSYPTEAELESLDGLVNETARLISKRVPAPGWPRWEKVNRYFPKLGLCKSVNELVTRIAVNTPARPYGYLMRSKEGPISNLRSAFFTTVSETRKSLCDPATVDWQQFEQLFLLYQNAELERPCKSLRLRAGAPSGPPPILAYVRFLEFERAEMMWTHRYGEHISTVKRWILGLKDAALLRKLEPFFAGQVNELEFANERFKESKLIWTRVRAAARKAKSRRKSGQKA